MREEPIESTTGFIYRLHHARECMTHDKSRPKEQRGSREESEVNIQQQCKQISNNELE